MYSTGPGQLHTPACPTYQLTANAERRKERKGKEKKIGREEERRKKIRDQKEGKGRGERRRKQSKEKQPK